MVLGNNMWCSAVCWLLAIQMILISAGCTSAPKFLSVDENYSEDKLHDVKAQIGKTVVVCGDFVPDYQVQLHKDNQSGAVVVAVIGIGVVGVLAAANPFVFLESLPALTAATPASAPSSTSEYLSVYSPYQAPFTDIETVVAKSAIQDRLRDRVLQVVEGAGRKDFGLSTTGGPKNIKEEIDYRALKQEQIETVLELVVVAVELRPIEKENIASPRELLVLLRERLINTENNQQFHGKYYLYQSLRRNGPYIDGAYQLGKWYERGGELLKEEIERSISKLSEEVLQKGALM